MSLDDEGPESPALWARIERTIASDIAAKRYGPGERLAPETALARRFRVNRHTVRRALGNLAARGVLRIERGRGTFVSEFAVEYVLGRRTRFTENLAAAGHQAHHRLIEAKRVRAGAELASRLGIEAGSPVHRIVSVGEAAGRVLTVGEHHFCARRFPGLPEAFTELGSLSLALTRLGVRDYTRVRSVVSARLPEPAIARALQQPAGRPVLLVESLNADPRGVVVESGRTWFAGDLVQLVVAPG